MHRCSDCGRRTVPDEYDQPDLSRVLASMKQNRHFTLLLAWRRCVDAKDVGKKCGYSHFHSFRRPSPHPRPGRDAAPRARAGDTRGLGR